MLYTETYIRFGDFSAPRREALVYHTPYQIKHRATSVLPPHKNVPELLKCPKKPLSVGYTKQTYLSS